MVRRLTLLRPKFSRYLNDDGTPKTIVKSGGSASFSKIWTGSERTPERLKKLYTYYEKEGIVFSAINMIALNTVMVGYSLHSDNTEALEFIRNFCRKVDLENFSYLAVRDALIFGDSFTEKIFNKKGDISRLKSVDPMTMTINTDKYGDIVNFEQKLSTGEKITIDKKYIMHLNFSPKPGSPYGISMIEPSEDYIVRAVKSFEALYNAFRRHGTKKYVATIGTKEDGELPPEEILEDVESKLEDIGEKMEFVLPWNCKIETIDEGGIEGIDKYYDFFLSLVIIGMMCPEEALGMGKNVTNATASVKAVLFERAIKAHQTRLSRIIEKELFNPMLKNNGFKEDEVLIRYNSVTEADEAMKAKWLGNLLRGFQYSRIKPFTINEIRTFFDMDRINIPEANKILFTQGELDVRKKEDEDGY